MSEPSGEDVLNKLDALMKRHQPAAEPDIPVLTDIVALPEIDLDAIPMLTEEVEQAPVLKPEPPSAPTLTAAPPLPEPEPIEFTLPATGTGEQVAPQPPSLSAELTAAPSAEPVELEFPVLEFDLPPGARYISLAPTVKAPVALAPEPQAMPATAANALSEETIRHIADIIKDDVAKVLDTQLQQALAQQLQGSLHVALDRALSSMLDQFIATIEEVVRVSIADELQKQLAPFKRPKSPE